MQLGINNTLEGNLIIFKFASPKKKKKYDHYYSCSFSVFFITLINVEVLLISLVGFSFGI